MRFCYIDKPGDTSDSCCVLISKLTVAIIYLTMWSGYFTYLIYIYFKIHKNDKFDIIKNINTDDFIKDFIKEIRERIKDKNRVLIEIILFSISMLFFILVWIFKPIHQSCVKSSSSIPDISKVSFNS